jgi:hypothetical protein
MALINLRFFTLNGAITAALPGAASRVPQIRWFKSLELLVGDQG